MQRYKKLVLKACLYLMLSVATVTIPEIMPAKTVEAAVKAPALKETKKTIYLGGSAYTVKINNLVKTAKVTYATSDKKIATVSKTGKVTPLAQGKVTITATVKQNNKSYTLKETITVKKKVLTAKELYEKCGPSTVEIHVSNTDLEYTAQGSGFFISENAIVTNYHVIAGANKIEVLTNDEKSYDVPTVLGYSIDLDLAILQISTKDHTYLKMSDDKVSVGETIYALGSPRGLTGTMSDGIISTASRIMDGVDYIQITAPISPGNSGGPLINEYGEVVGINAATIEDAQNLNQNLNFAINIGELQKINTTKPISIEDFYKEYFEMLKEALIKNVIQEDPARSQDLDNLQVIPSYTILTGTVTAAEESDIYRITVSEGGWFYGVIYLESQEDMKNAYLGIYDLTGRHLADCYEGKDNYYVYTEYYINPGDYYIGVYLPDGYMGTDLSYNFIWTMY